MGESPESLSPDNSKVSYAAAVDFGENTVEDVTEKVHAQTTHYSFTPLVTIAC